MLCRIVGEVIRPEENPTTLEVYCCRASGPGERGYSSCPTKREDDDRTHRARQAAAEVRYREGRPTKVGA